jgi:hypothetical protein
MAARAPKHLIREMTVESAVNEAVTMLTELGEELRGWADNIEEKFGSTEKYGRIDEAASTLEAIEEPEVDGDQLKALVVTAMFSTKKKPSRADRRDEATMLLDGAAQALREHAETEGLAEAVKQTAEQAADDIEAVKDEAEGVEFPGMYG